MTSSKLTINSKIKLNDGVECPIIGLGSLFFHKMILISVLSLTVKL